MMCYALVAPPLSVTAHNDQRLPLGGLRKSLVALEYIQNKILRKKSRTAQSCSPYLYVLWPGPGRPRLSINSTSHMLASSSSMLSNAGTAAEYVVMAGSNSRSSSRMR